MTKKRFIDDGFEAIEEQSFTDTETDKTYYVDYFDEIIDLANGLNEKNKVLRKEIERLKRQNEDILYNNAKNMELLEKENEQLQIASNENPILWNEIHILMEQGAEPSDAFKKYLDDISTDYDKFWRRKLKQAKKNKVIR